MHSIFIGQTLITLIGAPINSVVLAWQGAALALLARWLATAHAFGF